MARLLVGQYQRTGPMVPTNKFPFLNAFVIHGVLRPLEVTCFPSFVVMWLLKPTSHLAWIGFKVVRVSLILIFWLLYLHFFVLFLGVFVILPSVFLCHSLPISSNKNQTFNPTTSTSPPYSALKTCHIFIYATKIKHCTEISRFSKLEFCGNIFHVWPNNF